MPLLKYFITVGTVLTLGLFAINAYLEPTPSGHAARVAVTPTGAALLHFAPAVVAPQKAANPALKTAK
jgi:hypothetical protein